MVIHVGSDEDERAYNSTMTLTTIMDLQKSPKFKSLFNQLLLGLEARSTITETLISIATESGFH